MPTLTGINLNEYEEPTILDDGVEVEFRVIDAEQKSSEKADWVQLVLQPTNTDVTNPAIVYHNLFLPRNGDDKQRRNMRLGQVKRFCDSTGYVPADGLVNTDDLHGLSGRAVLKVQADEGYEPRNQVRRFVKV